MASRAAPSGGGDVAVVSDQLRKKEEEMEKARKEILAMEKKYKALKAEVDVLREKKLKMGRVRFEYFFFTRSLS
jgi:hypothetical protein